MISAFAPERRSGADPDSGFGAADVL